MLVVYRQRLGRFARRRARTVRHCEQLAPALSCQLVLPSSPRAERERTQRLGSDRAGTAEAQRATMRLVGARLEPGTRVEPPERQRFAGIARRVRALLDEVQELRGEPRQRQRGRAGYVRAQPPADARRPTE